MSRYEKEHEALKENYEGFYKKILNINSCRYDLLFDHLNNMRVLIDILENDEAKFNILNVIATYSSELSKAEYIYSGITVSPESLYNSLINTINHKKLGGIN